VTRSQARFYLAEASERLALVDASLPRLQRAFQQRLLAWRIEARWLEHRTDGRRANRRAALRRESGWQAVGRCGEPDLGEVTALDWVVLIAEE